MRFQTNVLMLPTAWQYVAGILKDEGYDTNSFYVVAIIMICMVGLQLNLLQIIITTLKHK
jgi:hypothetical protein